MSDIIKLLPDSVANQIAAGEVIQRPASVIKELVENAIDAGATSIQIVLKDAGRTLIQVIDNGKGMSDTDARLAFERHSTSKISKAEDLFSLQTMGFRGEALASIAAIAQVELRTRAKGAQLGTKIMINASKCESQEPDMCPEGSNFMIKNIFFNVPARRKFLKSNQVELSNIIKEYEKLALVNHHVDFSLSNNDKLLNKFSGGSFKQRIASLWGAKVDQQLVPLNTDTSLVRITGFVSKPEGARKRNFLQFLFVNGRFMRHPYFHKAIISSYSELIPDDEQPNYFLNFSVDPESIDVNILPKLISTPSMRLKSRRSTTIPWLRHQKMALTQPTTHLSHKAKAVLAVDHHTTHRAQATLVATHPTLCLIGKNSIKILRKANRRASHLLPNKMWRIRSLISEKWNQ